LGLDSASHPRKREKDETGRGNCHKRTVGKKGHTRKKKEKKRQQEKKVGNYIDTQTHITFLEYPARARSSPHVFFATFLDIFSLSHFHLAISIGFVFPLNLVQFIPCITFFLQISVTAPWSTQSSCGSCRNTTTSDRRRATFSAAIGALPTGL